MSAVDVLAVLAGLITDMGETPGTTGHQVEKARAAVAELIEAANAVSAHEELAIQDEWDRLRAALANVTGGAK